MSPNRRSSPRAQSRKHSPTGGLVIIDQSQNPEEHLANRTVTAEQRQIIRSHVMQVVRHLEDKAGVRRGLSRDKPKKRSPTTSSQTSSGTASTPTSPERREIPNVVILYPKDLKFPTTPDLVQDGSSRTEHTSTSHATSSVTELLQYCFDNFLPMVFPIDSNESTGNEKRINNILDSMINHPASFFSLLSAVAAHRVFSADADLDLDVLNHSGDRKAFDTTFSAMLLMKQYALSSISQLMNQKVGSNQSLDEEIIEAVFLLVGADLSVGNFSDPKLHLSYVDTSIRQAATFDHRSISNSLWIPLNDIEYASTCQSRPLFDLPWDQESVYEFLQDRVPPLPSNNKLRSMGRGFTTVMQSPAEGIQTIITQARLISLLGEFNAISSDGLSPSEHEQLYKKILQLQHDIVCHLYADPEEANLISPIEKIICLAFLALVSITMIRIIPSSGQGRAMTDHQHAAVHSWYQATSNPPTRAELKLMLWALLLFRQYSADDNKSENFESLLQSVAELLNIDTWRQVENVLYEFLYIPTMQRQDLHSVWNEVFQE